MTQLSILNNCSKDMLIELKRITISYESIHWGIIFATEQLALRYN